MKILKSYRTFVFSVFVAFFLWFYVKSSSRFQQTISIPLQVVNVKEGFGVVSALPSEVPVIFEGDGRTLLGLKYVYDIRFQLDMAQIKEDQPIVLGERLESVILPANVPARVMAVTSHDTIRVRYERLVEKKIPIRPQIEVSCAPGYVAVGSFRVRPDSLLVSCPVSFADSISGLPTEKLVLDELSQDRSVTVALGVKPSSRVRFVETEVAIDVDIQPLGEMVMDNLPVRLVNVPEGMRVVVQPSTYSIRIRGGIDFLSTLSRDSIQVIIDYEAEQKLNRIVPMVDVRAPSDIRWSQITPSRFNLVLVDETPLP